MSYAHMRIADIFQQFKTDEDIQCKVKNDVNLKGITVMGTIVNVICSPSPENPRTLPFILDIDDGTGVIRVVYFNSSSIPLSSTSLPTSGLSSIWFKVIGACDLQKLLQVGHTLEVKGVPQMYSSNVEMKAFAVRQVIDPNDEIDRMFALDQWRQNCSIVQGALPD